MSEYTLTFYQAIDKCLDGEGFIRGDDFAPGIYVAKSTNNELVVMDGKGSFRSKVGPLGITTGLRDQKYKLFPVANPKEIGL